MPTLMMAGALLVTAREVRAQEEPMPPHIKQAVLATVGNDALQLAWQAHNEPVKSADLDLGLLITEDRQFLGTGALMFGADVSQVPGLAVRFGPIGYLGWLEGVGKTQIAAIGGGVSARYDLFAGFGVTVHAFFTPGVLSFGAADNIYDFLAGAEYQASNKFTVLAGYRWLKITLNNQPDNKLLNEVYAGVRYHLK
jgi:hypothetical protein